MNVNVTDQAKDLGVPPKIIEDVLTELGVDVLNGSYEADNEILELVRLEAKTRGSSKSLSLEHGVTPRDIAVALGVPQPEIQKALVSKFKVMATLTTALKDDIAEKLVESYGYSVTWGAVVKQAPKTESGGATATKGGTVIRPPVVTILGHVDHGKTSLLDYIRKANVVAKEFGGITQHIGAYQVQLPEGKITFLDTPGHAAFTAMRARGAQVTDIAILVVAADDGLMPQTIEALNHVKNADVPMIVAVNKIDKAGANPEKVLQQLTEHQVVAEAYGGQTITCNVSALTGEGIPNLLEMILLQADVLELRADPKGPVEGVVIEAKLDKGRGPVATILVQNGTLKMGDVILVGNTFGKIRAMSNHLGERQKEAGPSTPVEVLGLNDVPSAGDKIVVTKDERTARDASSDRVSEQREKNLKGPVKRVTLRDIKTQLDSGDQKNLYLVVKADVHGSTEAVVGLIDKLESPEVTVKVIHSAVGSITESDILLASAADAIVVGFNVKPEGQAAQEAVRKGIEIRTYKIIYELIEDIELAMKGMLEPKYEEQELGAVDIRIRFQFGRKGIIAGCYVTEGKVIRNCSARVFRGGELVWEGKVASLKHLKDDVREVTMGMECGITFAGWEGFKEGDKIEAFDMVRVND